MTPTLLGALLLALGSSVVMAVWLILRVRSRLEPYSFTPSEDLTGLPPAIPDPIDKGQEAVLLVQPGGRIVYCNDPARDWFNLRQEEPNLERLARRLRPGNVFLELCAEESQARLTLEGRLIEGTSYSIPWIDGTAVLVSLRQPQWTLSAEPAPRLVNENDDAIIEPIIGTVSRSLTEADLVRYTLHLVTEFNRAITPCLELQSVVQSILEGVERSIAFDLAEINLWDSEQRCFLPYRLSGAANGDRKLQASSDRYKPGQGYTGYLMELHQPFLVKDVETERTVRPAFDRQRWPFQSYLGIPLMVGGELVGTLELTSLVKGGFSHGDLSLLKLLAEPAAMSLQNARRYEAERLHAQELGGLARLAQGVGSMSRPHELFTFLIESISPLLPVETLGFFVYDESRRMLKGRTPFIGIQSSIVEWYGLHVQPDSMAENILAAVEPIVSNHALTDPRFLALGLNDLAQMAGFRRAVLAPLNSGGRIQGLLLAADKIDGTQFHQDDLRFLSLLADQSAAMIDNWLLTEKSRRRALRAETQQRIASLMGSNATLDEILKSSLLDLAQLMKADLSAILLLDERRGELQLHPEYGFGLPFEEVFGWGRIPLGDPRFSQTVTSQGRPFSSGALWKEAAPIYRPIVDRPSVQSLIASPLLVRGRSIGELVLGSLQPDFFFQGDVLSAATAAGQLASAVEQAALTSLTDQSLRQRVEQMTALNHISREINSSLDLERLLQRVFDEARAAAHADCGSIALLELRSDLQPDQEGMEPSLLLRLGDGGETVLHPIEQAVIQTGDVVTVADFDTDGSFPPAHAGVRSALVVPIAYQGQAAGLIHLHANVSHLFDQAARELVETLAIQAAIALGNAHRYQEQVRRGEMLNRRLETLTRLFEISQALQRRPGLEHALAVIASAIQSATPFDIVLASLYEPNEKRLLRVAGVGIPDEMMKELRAYPQPWEKIQTLLQPEFCLGRAYLIPAERRPVIPTEIHMVTLLPSSTPPTTKDRWRAEDILIIPLSSPSGEPLGLISLDAPRNGLRPDRATIETLEIFGSQAALAIENELEVESLNAQTTVLEQELENARRIHLLAQEELQALSQKDLELANELQDLHRQAQRIQSGFRIAEAIGCQSSRAGTLLALAAELQLHMGMEMSMVVENTAAGPRLLQSSGPLPPGVNPQALLGQRNPLRQALHTGETLLVSNVEANAEWKTAPLLQALEVQSFICLSIYEDGTPCAAVLAASRSRQATFAPEDEGLFRMLAGQVNSALQNLKLVEETQRRLREVNLLQDFSRQLGTLDAGSILQALVESVLHILPAAQAGFATLWDSRKGLLVPQTASGYPQNARMLEISFQSGEALPGKCFAEGQILYMEEVELARDYCLPPENLLRYRDGTGGRPPVSALLVPISNSTGSNSHRNNTWTTPAGVLVLDNFTTTGAFGDEDRALVASLTQQTALALENADLYQASEQRAGQLKALARESAALSSTLERSELISNLLDGIQSVTPYDTGTLWLLEDTGDSGRRRADVQRMVVQAARGFTDSEERIGLSVSLQDSALLKEMITSGQPIYVPDIRQDERFHATSEWARFSWLGTPMLASGKVIGVIALEKAEPGGYTFEQIQMATTFAGQAATALQNASLYAESVRRAQELDRRSQRLGTLNRLSSQLSGSLEIERILESGVQELFQAVNVTSVSAVLIGGENIFQVCAEVSAEGGTHLFQPPHELPDAPLFEHMRQTLGIFLSEEVRDEPELAPLSGFLQELGAGSLMALPMASGNELHGILLAVVKGPYHFEPDEVELARTISNQVAIALQNARLFAQTCSLTEELEARVQARTVELAREHRRSAALVRIMTELSGSLDLEQVLNRTLLALIDSVDAEGARVLILRPGDKKLHHLAEAGPLQPAVDRLGAGPELDEMLSQWIISHRQPLRLDDLLQDERWAGEIQTGYLKVRSLIAVPLFLGSEALGSLLLFHTEPGRFSLDLLDLVQAAANQIAISVNNAELYRLVRNQAEDLSGILRSQQIETSRSRAILEAVADGVLVTDPAMTITLFNASAEKILDLNRLQVLGHSLNYFSGLVGETAQAWRETVQRWSQHPTDCQPGDTFAEQTTLGNGRVVAVRVAPVTIPSAQGEGQDFLGTVSIFQDITQQMELDRLKSDFVATVSHELRTPMTSIKGYVEILLMGAGGPLSEAQNRFLGVVKSSTERLCVLVDDLLDLSRIETGRVQLNLKELDLVGLADQAITDLLRRSQEEGKSLTIEKDLPDRLPCILGDEEYVRQILDNLLDNGYQYNLPGGSIWLRMHRVNGSIQVDVRDSGLGIPLEEQPRVFERFFRGENPLLLGVSGTGLGLSIVQNLVQMHGGRIWLESSGLPGEGCTFSFTLPVYQRESL